MHVCNPGLRFGQALSVWNRRTRPAREAPAPRSASAADPDGQQRSGWKRSPGPSRAPPVHPSEKVSFASPRAHLASRVSAPHCRSGDGGEPTRVSATRAFSIPGSPGDGWRASDWLGETKRVLTDTWTYIPSMLIRLLPFFSTELFLHCGWRRPKHVIYLFKKAILTKTCLQH